MRGGAPGDAGEPERDHGGHARRWVEGELTVLEIRPVIGIGEVLPGADLAALTVAAAPWLQDGDVLVVTSKVVSKAEGRLVALPPPGPERDRVRAELLAAETARPVASRGRTQIVATHHGFVMAAAGIDASNVDPSTVVLLPKDPDASARELREAFARRHGLRVAVIVSDTMGRPWRNGLTDVALGAAGIAPLRDHRGETDPYGNLLHVTELAVVDELAAAAELVKGKRDQVPVAVVRGVPERLLGEAPGVVPALVRDPAQDMFRLGTTEAYAAGLRDAATLPDAPAGSGTVDLATVRRALDTVATVVSSRLELVTDPAVRVRCAAADPDDPAALVRLGADLHRLRAALAAEGMTSTPSYADGEALLEVRAALPSG